MGGEESWIGAIPKGARLGNLTIEMFFVGISRVRDGDHLRIMPCARAGLDHLENCDFVPTSATGTTITTNMDTGIWVGNSSYVPLNLYFEKLFRVCRKTNPSTLSSIMVPQTKQLGISYSGKAKIDLANLLGVWIQRYNNKTNSLSTGEDASHSHLSWEVLRTFDRWNTFASCEFESCSWVVSVSDASLPKTYLACALYLFSCRSSPWAVWTPDRSTIWYVHRNVFPAILGATFVLHVWLERKDSSSHLSHLWLVLQNLEDFEVSSVELDSIEHEIASTCVRGAS